MNKDNDKDWIGIPECVKDVDDNELKGTLLESSLCQKNVDIYFSFYIFFSL